MLSQKWRPPIVGHIVSTHAAGKLNNGRAASSSRSGTRPRLAASYAPREHSSTTLSKRAALPLSVGGVDLRPTPYWTREDPHMLMR